MSRIVAMICLWGVTLSAAGIADDESVAQWFPDHTPVCVEIPDPAGMITMLLEHPLREKLEALPQYQAAMKSQDYRNFLTMRKMVEIQFGMSWHEAIRALTQHGIAAGFDSETQGVTILARGTDSQTMDRLVKKTVDMAMVSGNQSEIKPATYRDRGCYRTKNGWFALIDDKLIISNRPKAGQAAVDRILDGSHNALTDNPRYQEVRSRRSPQATIGLFVDTQVLGASGVFEGPLREATRDNPVLELIAGGIIGAARDAPWASAELEMTSRELRIDGLLPHDTQQIAEEREYYFGPDGSGRSPRLPDIPGTLLTLTAWRDFSEMWLRADDLFSAPVVDGFAQASAGLSTLFGGSDFTEDILGAFTPEWAFIMTQRDFSDVLPRPAIELPAIALFLEFRDAEDSVREFRRIYQTMIGFFNVLGAMEGNRQMEIDLESLDKDAQVLSATFVPEEGEESSTSADVIVNLEPSVGFNGSRFVVATTKELAQQLTTAPTRNAEPADTNLQLTVDAAVLHQVMEQNREQLIAQNMLTDGNTREEAEAAIAFILEFAGYFKDATLRILPDDDALKFGMTIQLAP